MTETHPHTTYSSIHPYPKFSVAPMLDWTDRHCRYFYRVMSKHALLYSEMVTTGAIIHGDRDRHLYFEEEGPVALQLGGSDPADLKESAKIGEGYGYSEINLNCGCPSDRVQKGRFGACLMTEPELVAECYSAMADAVSVPVTIKARIGIDDEESFEFLDRFIQTISAAGCTTFILHARKAWLSGLSPKENRDIPPLNYERVYAMKAKYPELTIAINGGIPDLGASKAHLNHVDGVMLGRAVYHDPYMMAAVDRDIFADDHKILSRFEVLMAMEDYINRHLEKGGRLNHIARHMLGLFHGVPRSRIFRRYVSEHIHLEGASFKTLIDAYKAMESA